MVEPVTEIPECYIIKKYLELNTTKNQRWRETLKALESVQRGNTVKSELIDAWFESWGKSDETIRLNICISSLQQREF